MTARADFAEKARDLGQGSAKSPGRFFSSRNRKREKCSAYSVQVLQVEHDGLTVQFISTGHAVVHYYP
jgi:hypothetical protein